MRTLIAATAFVSFFAAGAAVSACGSKESAARDGPPATYAAGQPCPPAGYPGGAPPGCTPYPTTAPPTYTATGPTGTAPPPPGTTGPTPTTTATGMSTQGTIACTDDGPLCGTAHCNKTIGKCANPCTSTQFDCIPGNFCTVLPVVGAVCQPVQAAGQVLP